MQMLESALSISLKNILLATDFSPGSDVALRHAQALALSHKANVYTIHVAAPDCYQLLNPEAFAITFNEWAGSAKDPIEILHELMQGLPSQVPVNSGAIWQVVNEMIRRNQIDLLVLSSHGRQGISRLVLGSVAEEVFRNVPCPVLTVGPDVKDHGANGLEIKNVLLATHFERNSMAPGYAKWLCNEFHAQLTVLHVADERQPEVKSAAQLARLRDTVPDDGSLWRKPALMLASGVPSAKILEVAGQSHADVIVLGARHPEPARINSHLPWATAARVIAEASCPVLTVREREGDGTY
jgi:nucleotide-binding universal stress UspA family protein